MQAVIEQLKINNRSEAGRDSRHTMMLNELKVQNQEGFQNLINTLSGKLQDVKDSVEDTTDTKPDDKGDKPLKSSDEEKENRMMRVFKGITTGLSDLKNTFSKDFKRLTGALSSTKDFFLKTPLGAFLLVGALGTLTALLNSELWKDLKEKYLPSLKAGIQSIKDTFSGIIDGFFVEKEGKWTFSATAGLFNIFSMIGGAFKDWAVSLKDGFFDENGEFSLLAGLKNAALEFGNLVAVFAVGSAFMLALAPNTFFGALWVGKKLFGGILGAGGTVAKAFGKLFLSGKGLEDALSATDLEMGDSLKKSKKTGAFRKGLGGLGKRFGRLFRFFGTKRGLGALIIGAGVAITSVLDMEKAKGIFSAGKNGLTNIFNGAFDVVKNFGSSFKNLVSAAGGKLKDVFKGAQTDVDGKKPDADKKPEGKNKAGKTRAEIEAEKKNKAKIDPELDKRQKENLKKMEADRLAIEKAQFEANKKRQDINRQLRNADAEMVKKDLEAQKKKKLALEAEKKAEAARLEKQRLEAEKKRLNLVDIDAKKLNKSLLKATARFTAKAVPIAGAFFGIFETGRRLIQGDFGGAAREAGGIFLPSVAGAPVDASLMATDIYKDMFGTTYEADLLKDASLANQRMKIIGSKITDYFKGQETAANASAISPMMEAGRGNIYNTYNNVDNSSQSSSQTHLNNGMSDSGAPAGSSVRPF